MAKIFFETHGCSANISETEVMMGLLKNAGYGFSDKISDSDIVIFNSCTVKGEGSSLKRIKEIADLHPYKKYILAGCLTPNLIAEIRNLIPEASFVNTHNLGKIAEVAEEIGNGNRVEVLSRERQVKLAMPKVRKNPAIGIVPILNSCNNHCSFCSVWIVKGPLMSYPEKKIIEEVITCVKDGCREIWITSQDNGAYNMDKSGKSKFPKLLGKICSLKGDFMVRIGMINPQHIIPSLNEYIKALMHPKVFRFLHIPVQSGSNEILKKMERGYTIEEFKKAVDAFRKGIKGLTISTDIICGFPGETEGDFQETLRLAKEMKFDTINISRFSPRPDTKAARMKQLGGGVIKERSRAITEVSKEISMEQNLKWKGWEGEIIIDEKGRGNTMVGRNFAYKQVIVKGSYPLGSKINVKITDAMEYYLKGAAT
ncbi:MAG TPA: tRNA (N(6)-L-threonylcarbamoyladenosine(37)-C(2))-methylthiotransferase [Candidatus Nanoarchaeia archaeon]|nr:tRNA (N(6)-L-threonylcarbamoyladenosine(37)-C(2))-methylthiotransferase [Candidatus Nanoarchaeia archaeon]